MNTQLVYPMTQFRGFADNSAWMQNNLYMPFEEPQPMSQQDVFGIANTHRTNLVPIFADESRFLPTNVVNGDAGAVIVDTMPVATSSVVASSVPVQSNQVKQTNSKNTLTKNEKEMYIVDGILIALGAVLLVKLIS